MFIRDEIRARDLDRRYKRAMCFSATLFAYRALPCGWSKRFTFFHYKTLLEKLLLKGA